MPQLKLSGIFPPIPTPFNHSGDIYLAKIRSNVEKWNMTTLAGYVVCGSTGESVYLTEPEKLYLWEEVAKYAPSTKLLIAGTGVESVRETVHLTNSAADLGYKCAMVRTPHYYKNLLNNLEAQALYFRSVADQSKIPLMIYNWPQSTGLDISVDTVALLSEHPNIIAIKESSGNMDKVHALLKAVKPGFQVLNKPIVWQLTAREQAQTVDEARGHEAVPPRPACREARVSPTPARSSRGSATTATRLAQGTTSTFRAILGVVMSSAAVRQVIALAAELSEEERRVVVDAIAPQESVAVLAAEWEAEIARRAERVRTGQSVGKPANEVFDRLEAQLKAR